MLSPEKGADDTRCGPGQRSTPGLDLHKVIKLREQTLPQSSERRRHSKAGIVCLQMRWLMGLIIKALFWSQTITGQAIIAP